VWPISENGREGVRGHRLSRHVGTDGKLCKDRGGLANKLPEMIWNTYEWTSAVSKPSDQCTHDMPMP